jgi:hypothetical protein
MRKRHLWGPATTLALVLPLGAAASSANGALTSAPSPTTDHSDVVTTVAVTLPETRTVTRKLRTVQRGALESASPLRSSWPAVDLDALDIPATAMHAYQFAAYTMEKADPSCRLDWSLLAGIGQVDAELGDDGVSHPLIRGAVLNGDDGTSRVRDTDAGELDGDRAWDRGVGPLQFLPSTWAYSGVDGDGDGLRTPDDIDDASLAAAVYLCAGSERLDIPRGVRAAIQRYNPSADYAAAVLPVARAYRTGDFILPAVPGTAPTSRLTRRATGRRSRTRQLPPTTRPRSGPGRAARTSSRRPQRRPAPTPPTRRPPTRPTRPDTRVASRARATATGAATETATGPPRRPRRHRPPRRHLRPARRRSPRSSRLTPLRRPPTSPHSKAHSRAATASGTSGTRCSTWATRRGWPSPPRPTSTSTVASRPTSTSSAACSAPTSWSACSPRTRPRRCCTR